MNQNCSHVLSSGSGVFTCSLHHGLSKVPCGLLFSPSNIPVKLQHLFKRCRKGDEQDGQDLAHTLDWRKTELGIDGKLMVKLRNEDPGYFQNGIFDGTAIFSTFIRNTSGHILNTRALHPVHIRIVIRKKPHFCFGFLRTAELNKTASLIHSYVIHSCVRASSLKQQNLLVPGMRTVMTKDR